MSDEIRAAIMSTIEKIESLEQNQSGIDTLWGDVKSLFLNEMNKLPDLPQSNNKNLNKMLRKSQPFWDTELENLWRSACQAEKMYLKFKVAKRADLQYKKTLHENFKNAQKVFDKRHRYLKRQHRDKEMMELCKLATEKSPKIWDKLKQLNDKKTPEKVLEIVKEDKSISRDIGEILQRWHHDIAKLYSGLREDPNISFDDSFYSDIVAKKREFEQLQELERTDTSLKNENEIDINLDISYSEVAKAIDRAKCGKSFLEVPNDALKNENAKLLLHRLYNMCFKTGLNPTDWYFSNIVPIPKPDKDHRDPLQNRCITIICCVAKVYSSILNSRIQQFIESKGLLVEEQNGFRASRSCIDHIFVLVTILRNRLAMGKDTFLAFVDYKKAFDSVDQDMLLYKLYQIGIRDKMYRAISSLYKNPQSRVILNDHYTDYFHCPIGVKQGDCLSPTLFSIYINDLANLIKESNLGVEVSTGEYGDTIEFISILMYADDIVLLSETEVDLQELLFVVERWCFKWRLEVNVSKTNILHVRRKKKSQSRFWFLLNNQTVEYCSSYKYLGVFITEHLDFDFTVSSQSASAGRALSSVICKMIKNKGFPFNIYSLLYTSCVTSISDYSSAVTGFKEYDSLEKLHLRAVRAFLGAPKNACNAGVQSEVNLLLPRYRTKLEMVRYYARLMQMSTDRLPHKILIWDKRVNQSSEIVTWSHEVKVIFEECNMLQVLESNFPLNVKETVEEMKQAFFLKQCRSLELECLAKPKLRTFMQFKDFNSIANYTTLPLSFFQRRVIAKLRLGCLPLRVETGRYQVPRLPEDERICLLCFQNGTLTGTCLDIENEFHFLFLCTAFNDERKIWLNKLVLPNGFSDMPNVEKLKIALNESSNIKHTANFLIAAFNERSKVIFSHNL